MQVQQGQHVRDLRRLTCPRGQDRRREPHPLPSRLINALVVDPGCLDRHRPGGGGHLTGRVGAVTDHQPVPVFVDLVGVQLDVGGHLGLQRRSEHPPGPLASQLVQHRPTHPRRGVLIGLVPVGDYRKHGRTFPNQRVNAGPDQSYLDFRSSPGRCAPSRHPAEDHPQVLIIALRTARKARASLGHPVAPVFTGASSDITVPSCFLSLPPFPMRSAFPTSEYYDGSAPTHTLRPATRLSPPRWWGTECGGFPRSLLFG